ncbi:MAG: DUF371 domain-containing protein [Candidatus Altiarchaeota archaeon]
MTTETIKAKGHINVLSTHNTTLEFTKANHLSKRGDCIIAVAADKSMLNLSDEFKKAVRNENAKVEITIECGGIKDTINAHGHPKLTLTHPADFVVRKSDYICSRTLAIKADKAACDIKRELVEELKTAAQVTLTLKVIKRSYLEQCKP